MKKEWSNTREAKLWGLMTVWAQTKFAFPHTERLKEIDWDGKVREFIPKVLDADNVETYYKILAELTALLRDSHTEIIPPWGRMTPGYDFPPVEIKIIDDRFYIIRTGNNLELKEQNVTPGTEILEIGEGIPAMQFFKDNVLKYHSRGSKRADEAVLVFYLLYGPAGTKVNMKVTSPEYGIRNVELTRNATTGKGKPFMYEFLNYLFAQTIQQRMLEKNILYVNLPNFESANKNIRDDFIALIDETDFTGIKGMIIDLRYNMGGSHKIMQPLVSCLIDSSVKVPLHHYLQYTPAPTTWGNNPAFEFRKMTMDIHPRKGKRYSGPIIVLMSPMTHSSGEDMIIELIQTGRCISVGEPTAGGAGGKLPFPLPGGGEFALSTFKATFPDGTEYMTNGIQPDILVRNSLEDIVTGRDRVLEKGIDAIIKNIKPN
jgi:C-terminal processing protease CtpA/Prc